MAISKDGIIIRIKVEDISKMGRTTQGVTIMKVAEEDLVISITRVVEHDETEKTAKKEMTLFEEE
jgi:DNA gyrase subunit A